MDPKQESDKPETRGVPGRTPKENPGEPKPQTGQSQQ
jgi:hypothetical protein